MTDNEIIKALECCIKAETIDDCERLKCPACDDIGCRFFDNADDNTIEVAREMGERIFSLINRQKAEIERLTKENEEQDQAIINALHRMGEIRSEAVNEFAERANEKLSYHLEKCGDFAPYGMADIINNLAKEMTEDEGK